MHRDDEPSKGSRKKFIPKVTDRRLDLQTGHTQRFGLSWWESALYCGRMSA